MQVECKWCGKFSKDNFKHRFYTTCNLWEEAPLPFVYNILWLSTKATSNWHFFLRFPNGVPKLRLLLSQNIGHSYFSQIKTFLKHVRATSYNSQKDLSNGVSHTPIENHLAPALRRICGRESNSLRGTMGKSFTNFSQITKTVYRCGLWWSP